MARTLTVAPILLLLVLVTSAAAAEDWIVGTWTTGGEGDRVTVTFHADGRLLVAEHVGGATEQSRGTYQVGADAIVVNAEGETLRYPFRRRDADTLVVTDADGTTLVLRRQAAPTPVAEDALPLAAFEPYALLDHRGLMDPRTGRPLVVFRMLIPAGWRFEGGITWKVHVKDPTRLTRADLVSPADIAFRVVSPDGSAWLEVFPELKFADLTQAPAGPAFPAGRPYGGMTSMPVMDPDAYLTNVLLPRHRASVASPRVVERRDAPGLAGLYLEEARRFNAMAGGVGAGSMRVVARGLTVDYGLGGVPYREDFLAALFYLQTPGITLWSHRAAWGIGAPQQHFEAYRKTLLTCVYSIQFQALWFLRFMKLTHENWRGIAETDALIAKLDTEIVKNRIKTNLKINAEVQKLLIPYGDYGNPTGGPPITLPNQGPHYVNPTTGAVEPASGTGPHRREDDPNWKKLEPVAFD